MTKHDLAALVAQLPDDAHSIIIRDRRGATLYFSTNVPQPHCVAVPNLAYYGSLYRYSITNN